MRTARIWGTFDVYPARYGVARCRLVVFPPGITVSERRMLKAWRSWPLWGATLWLVLQIGGSAVGMSATALIAGTMIYIAAGAITFALAGETRMRVRTLWAVTVAGCPNDEEERRYSVLRVMAQALDHADRDLDRGRLTPPQHEARWWQVYDLLGTLAPEGASATAPTR